ncbi:hypothetical protein E1I18_00230 [Mycoplasmopsis mucosicanis]|uniref:Uncharacterized protein n=1 Tax=Mycoplasmopsis mucosicanis TaxID=458208 RepID=A0A507SSG9_9BACT|nr:hypothetical protein [Mycoplasmopsis mucosicanis]TQC54191.1 hypothetical protein E1I18_00230 [Mycoplasmopsis mucosicanis]
MKNIATEKPVIYKPYFAKIEQKKQNEIIATQSLGIGAEFIKFFLLVLLVSILLLFQFSHHLIKDDAVVSKIEIIYKYSLGLSFGNLAWFIVFGIFASLVINWAEAILKKYYCFWLKHYTRVDYWIIRKRVKMFLWMNILVFVLIYHWFLVSQRQLSSNFVYNSEDLKNIFIRGWYWSFTQDSSSNNLGHIGIFLDSILNILHIVAVSPWLVLTLILLIQLLAWLYLLTLKPSTYFKYFAGNKNLKIVKAQLKKINNIFHYTNETERYLNYLILSAQVLEIDINTVSMNKLIKLIKKDIDIVAQNPLTSKFFIKPQKLKKRSSDQNDEFVENIDRELNKSSIDEHEDNQVVIIEAQTNSEISQNTDNSVVLEENNNYLTHSNNTETQDNNIETNNHASNEEHEEEIADLSKNVDSTETSIQLNTNTVEQSNLTNNIDKTIELNSVLTSEFIANQTIKDITKPETQTESIVINVNSENAQTSDKSTRKIGFIIPNTEETNIEHDEQKNDVNTQKTVGFVNIDTSEFNTVETEKTQQNANETHSSVNKKNKNCIELDDGDWESPFEA